MERHQLLVVFALKRERELHRVERVEARVLLAGRRAKLRLSARQRREFDLSTSRVLILEQGLGVALLLLRLRLEERRQARKRDVVPPEVRVQPGVHVEVGVLGVDLFVERGGARLGPVGTRQRVGGRLGQLRHVQVQVGEEVENDRRLLLLWDGAHVGGGGGASQHATSARGEGRSPRARAGDSPHGTARGGFGSNHVQN
mmetsp:Transcript_8845/g.29102  ORF Transcript_8845/g.29102 Transcript_8845/m.29102 type:complete len:200 (+) Transcript_8845:1425-2024(+)